MFKGKNRIIMIKISRGGKMKTVLKQFKINGFRNLTNVTLNLNDVTAIVGLNSYGKSNVINAINMGIRFIKAPSEEKIRYMSNRSMYPLLKKNAGTDFSFEFTAEIINENNEKADVTYGYTFSWDTEQSECGIKEEHLFIKSERSGGKHISREGSAAKYKRSPQGRCQVKIDIDDDQLVINKLENFDNLFYLEIVKALNSIDFWIIKEFDVSKSFLPARIAFNEFGVIDSENLFPGAVWDIKTKYEKSYKKLINSFKLLFPTIDRIECIKIPLTKDHETRSDDDSSVIFHEDLFTLSFKDSKLTQTLRFEALSDGTKRIFYTLVCAVLSDIDNCSLMILEEPENSIHPSLLQSYLRILDDLSGDCKIIFTSHSPYMIQYLDLNDIYIGMPSSSGEADFRTIKKPEKLMKDAAKFDQSTGDFIFESLSFANADDMLGEYLSETTLDIDDTDSDDDDDWLNDDGGDE